MSSSSLSDVLNETTTASNRTRLLSKCDENNLDDGLIGEMTTLTTTNLPSNTSSSKMMMMHCPVQGCDSSGCLDGSGGMGGGEKRHYSYDKCPVYFGMSMSECERRRGEFEKRMRELREKLASSISMVQDGAVGGSGGGKKILRNKVNFLNYFKKFVKIS